VVQVTQPPTREPEVRPRPELIVVLPRGGRGDRSERSLDEWLESSGLKMRPLVPPQLLDTRGELAAEASLELLRRYRRVEADTDELDDIAAEIHNQVGVAGAYVAPAVRLPTLNNMRPSGPVPRIGATPDFRERQGYLQPAPGGVGVAAARSERGGQGEGISVVDVEGGCRYSHEALVGVADDLGTGTNGDEDWRNHGTAVLGVVGARDDGLGVSGIAPAAALSMASVLGPGASASEAIIAAALRMQPGDILLLELHRPGPRYAYEDREDQLGFIPIEWWPHDYDAIRFAVERGIVVVEAADNGGEDLDAGTYDVPHPGFATDWQNPLGRLRDSGAIIVGAGAPPLGTHDQNHGPDRSRLDFSNYGDAVDAQGWGRAVTTLGYGDLQGGLEDRWYTDEFSGTSSASPIVVGVLACMQGVRKARGWAPLTSRAARDMLRASGSPQQDGLAGSGRIGSRPDLETLLRDLKA
jgi:hypothetical protein